jgi:hypothetical protein
MNARRPPTVQAIIRWLALRCCDARSPTGGLSGHGGECRVRPNDDRAVRLERVSDLTEPGSVGVAVATGARSAVVLPRLMAVPNRG